MNTSNDKDVTEIPKTRSLSFRLIVYCLFVVASVGAILSTGRYYRSRQTLRLAHDSRMRSLTESAAAMSQLPLEARAFDRVRRLAQDYCSREADLARFVVKKPDGTVLVDVVSEAHRIDDDVRTRDAVVRSSESDKDVIGQVLLTFSYEPVNKRLRSIVFYDVALYALIFFVMALTIAGLIRRGILKPVAELAEKAKELGRGNMANPIPQASHQELAILSDTLELMRQRLQQTLTEQNKTNTKLLEEVETRSEAEGKMREALDEAKKANRMKDAFLSNTSHELRTPLAAIMGFADSLQRYQHLGDQFDKSVGAIRRNAKHLLFVIEDLLDLSKIASGALVVRRDPLKVATFLENVKTDAVQACQGNLDLTIDMEARWAEIEVLTDGGRIGQIVRNLVENSSKHAPGAQVILRARLNELKNSESMELLIEVEDNGPGIAPGQLDSIFEPFQQFGEGPSVAMHGAGLGLSISRTLAHAMGGTLEVTPIKPSGVKFSLQLAVAVVCAEERAKEAPPYQNKHDDDNFKILLVDDCEDMRDLTLYYLKADGDHKIDTAGDGEEALARYGLALDLGRPYDCILMDVRMPVLDGYQAVERLRTLGCDVPVIALTAHAMEREKDRCLEAGFSDYLSKPLDFKLLLQKMSDHVQAARLAQRTS